MTKTSSGYLIQSLQSYLDQIPFVRPMGIRVREAKPGFVSVEMMSHASLLNQMGTYQAGSLFTLAEVTGGILCGTFFDLSKHFLITKKAEIQFQRASNQILTAEAALGEEAVCHIRDELDRRRKKDAAVTVTIKDRDGKTILTCVLIYYLRLGIPRAFRMPSKADERLRPEPES